MSGDTITREEFDARLNAANAHRERELRRMEDQLAQTENLLSYYEGILAEIEGQLDGPVESIPHPALLRQRLNELAERTARVAAAV
jgi:hypothetical protein